MELSGSRQEVNPRVGPAGPPYRAGTLSYTRAALVTLFVYLLWGDFCFTAMETIVPSVLPIMLKEDAWRRGSLPGARLNYFFAVSSAIRSSSAFIAPAASAVHAPGSMNGLGPSGF
jgi:hypothetical protein